MNKKNKILASILLLATTAIGNVEAKTRRLTNIIGFGDSFVSMQNSFVSELANIYHVPPGITNFAGSQNYTNLTNQVTNYLATTGGRADPNALYIMDSTNFELWEGLSGDVGNFLAENLGNTLTNELINTLGNVALLNAMAADPALLAAVLAVPGGGPIAPADALAILTALYPLFIPTAGPDIINALATTATQVSASIAAWGNCRNSDFVPTQFNTMLNTHVRVPLTSYLQKLSTAGAQHIVLPTVFNDAYRQQVPGAWYDRATREINSTIDDVVAKFPNLNIIFVDHGRLIEEIALNPSVYLPASEVAKLTHILDANGVVTASNLPSAFDASSHPSPYVHKILASLTENTIEAPARVAYARELPLKAGDQFFHHIRDHAFGLPDAIAMAPAIPNNQVNSGRSGGDFICDKVAKNYAPVGVGIDYLGFTGKQKVGWYPTRLKIKKGNAIDVYGFSNYDINDEAVFGLQVHGTEFKYKLGNKARYRVQQYLIGAHGSYQLSNMTGGCPVFLFGGAAVGQIQYNIKRYIHLGQLRRTEKGRPTGMHYLVNLGVGYNHTFATGCDCKTYVSVSPYASLNYQDVSMKKYKEKYCQGNKHSACNGSYKPGTSSTMKFKKMHNRRSLVGEIGATILMPELPLHKNCNLTPSVTLSYGREFLKQDKKVYGAILNKSRYFWTRTYDVDRDFFGINGQLRTNIENGHVGIRAGTRLAKRIKTYTVGLFAGINL